MLVVNAKLPIHSVKELVEYAKVHPGELSFASGNTAGIVGGHTLAKWGEMSMLHVPYKTTGPALEDIIAGRVSMMFADFTTAMPHVEAGTVRPLAISRIARSSLHPDLPTMDEAGVTGFNLDAWAGLVAGADRDETQRRAAQRHRQPGRPGQVQNHRLRGIFQHARGAGGFHQGPARRVGKDGQGRRHQSGLTLELGEGFRRRVAGSKAVIDSRCDTLRYCTYVDVGSWHKADMPVVSLDVRFSNRPSGVKRFQAIHQLQCRCRSRALASLRTRHQGPFHHGIRRRGGTIFRATLPSM